MRGYSSAMWFLFVISLLSFVIFLFLMQGQKNKNKKKTIVDSRVAPVVSPKLTKN
jgi:preprotein translocase subunit YajC